MCTSVAPFTVTNVRTNCKSAYCKKQFFLAEEFSNRIRLVTKKMQHYNKSIQLLIYYKGRNLYLEVLFGKVFLIQIILLRNLHMSDKIMKIIGLPIYYARTTAWSMYYVTHLTPKLGYIIIRIEL